MAPDSESFQPGDADIVCKQGVSLGFYHKAKAWLAKDEGRRLFCIENSSDNQEEMLQNRQVQIFTAETPVARLLALKKIAWLSLFKKLKWIDVEESLYLETQLLGATLLASDGADFGTTVMRHLKANFRKPLRRLSALDGCMKGVPAIVMGAGPSLEKNGHLIEKWQDKALVITAGNAIHAAKIRPSLAVLLDPFESIKKTTHIGVPFCLQGRTNPKSRSCLSGEGFYFPDSHFAFEPWLLEEEIFNTGWTVGNGAVAIAHRLGCNPIMMVGMDYCYQEGQKYAWKKGGGDMPLIPATNAAGQKVSTQADWLLALHWMAELAAANPDVSFINATAGGMKMAPPVQTALLPEPFGEAHVRARWEEAIRKAPFIHLNPQRLKLWQESLIACKWNLERDEAGTLAENVANQLLLEPLWNIWGPVFERELMTDTHPIPQAEKLAIQKRLFFNRVIEAHLHE